MMSDTLFITLDDNSTELNGKIFNFTNLSIFESTVTEVLHNTANSYIN